MFLSLQIISLVSSCSHASIYTVKYVVKEYCGILSGGIIILSESPRAIAQDKAVSILETIVTVTKRFAVFVFINSIFICLLLCPCNRLQCIKVNH